MNGIEAALTMTLGYQLPPVGESSKFKGRAYGIDESRTAHASLTSTNDRQHGVQR
jgi:hypothetical protein